MKLKPTDLHRSESGHGEARDRHHRQPYRPARAGRKERCSSTGSPAPSIEVLVQLPGVDDPARAKELIGTAAVLEIAEVKDGPFPSREAALAPSTAAFCRWAPSWSDPSRAARSEGEQWYLVGKTPVDTRPRDAQRAPRPGRIPQVGNQLQSVARTAAGASAATPKPISAIKLAVVLDNQIVSVATIQSQDRGFRPHHRAWAAKRRAVDLSRYLRSGSLPAGVIT